MSSLTRIAALLAGLVVVAVFLALLFLDGIARRGIEEGASFALGVETTLDSAAIRIFTGSFGLGGLEVANPPGFENPHFLEVDEARLDLELATLREPVVVAPLLQIDGIQVDLDKQRHGTNYDAILDNLARFESNEAPEPDPSESGKRFLIEQIVVRNVLAHVRVIGAEIPQIDVVVPEVRIDGVGQGGKPLTTAEVTDLIVKSVLASIARAGTGLPGGIAGSLTSGLGRLTHVEVELPDGGRLADAAGAGVDAASDAVGAGADAASDAVGAGADAVQDAGSALKDLGGELLGDD